MTLSLQLWNSTGTCLEFSHEATWCAGELYHPPKGHKWACWKEIKFSSTTTDASWTYTRANRVEIVKSVITKIFITSKYLTITIQHLKDTLLFCLYCLLSVFIVQLLLFSAFVRFSFIWFSAFCSIRCFCSVFKLFGIFSVLILEMYSRYFDPVIQQPKAVNKHHTADSAIFVLV
jgi:hypothetical protein